MTVEEWESAKRRSIDDFSRCGPSGGTEGTTPVPRPSAPAAAACASPIQPRPATTPSASSRMHQGAVLRRGGLLSVQVGCQGPQFEPALDLGGMGGRPLAGIVLRARNHFERAREAKEGPPGLRRNARARGRRRWDRRWVLWAAVSPPGGFCGAVAGGLSPCSLRWADLAFAGGKRGVLRVSFVSLETVPLSSTISKSARPQLVAQGVLPGDTGAFPRPIVLVRFVEATPPPFPFLAPNRQRNRRGKKVSGNSREEWAEGASGAR